MTSFTSSTGTMNYQYRADGMRTRKSTSSGFTEYYHDGQMPMEDAVVSGTSLTATRYGLGARGVDYEEVATGTYTNGTTRTVGAYSNVGFPIYDAHGNMTATLARSGTGYQVNNLRSYDAWGAIRQGAVTADPKNRYCANLGHQQDDESGLIYMRARYYEPGSGRFISEDTGKDGANWLIYAANDPVKGVDLDGKESVEQAFLIGCVFAFVTTLTGWLTTIGFTGKLSNADMLKDALVAIFAAGAEAIFAEGKLLTRSQLSSKLWIQTLKGGLLGTGIGLAAAISLGMESGREAAELWYDSNWDKVSC